jgi:hypothetical protein
LRRLLALTVPMTALLLFGGVTVAHADPPTRTPVEISDFVLQAPLGHDPCGFPVKLEVLDNNEVATTFMRQDGIMSVHATGTLKVRLTNQTAPVHTVDVNISGPTQLTFNPDGSITQVALGRALWAFEPGIAPGLPRIAVISGRTDSMFDRNGAFALLRVQGNAEDMCAVLTA